MEKLEKCVYKDTRTISLMDEFERRNEKGEKVYSALVLRDVFGIKYRKKLYFISLTIERKPHEGICVNNSLTFTDLKQLLLDHVFKTDDRGKYKVVDAVLDELKHLDAASFNEGTVVCKFPIPVKFNAQNSSNRSGYGNRYCGEELVYEGTLYGETTDYIFTGATIRKFGT